MSDRDIQDELAAVADEAEAHRDDEPRTRLRSRRPPRDPSQVYSIRIPVERLEELRRLAAERDTAPTALMRRWVLERLDVEQRRPGPIPVAPGVWEVRATTIDPRLIPRANAVTMAALASALVRFEAAS